MRSKQKITVEHHNDTVSSLNRIARQNGITRHQLIVRVVSGFVGSGGDLSVFSRSKTPEA